jgi:hypothetical protein
MSGSRPFNQSASCQPALQRVRDAGVGPVGKGNAEALLALKVEYDLKTRL